VAVLVVNAGSTSLKLSLVGPDEVSRPVGSLAEAGAVDAVAHRVVHGGPAFREPVLVDDDVQIRLETVADLAPLHNRPALQALAEARRALPGVPHVCVFDCAFHATMPPEASTYALPRRWREEWGIRRYGFHGLAVQWAAEAVRVPRLVVCHLGGGCSVSAVRDGRSVDTSMGFAPTEGVPMATRAGTTDAEIALHLLRRELADAEQIESALEEASGLLGLSELSARVEELEASDDPRAALALEVFAYRVATAVGAMAVPLGGLDALVFSGGVGEHGAGVRARVCGRLGFLGVELDPAANAAAVPDAEIGAGPVRVVVLHAREDVVAARAARALLAAQP
jgi:acetate kinase